MYFVEEDLRSKEVRTHVMRSRYYAIEIKKLVALMGEVGFQNVVRLDQGFYQPIVVGTKPG